MTELFEGVSLIIKETFKLLATVTTSLLSNYLFQITLGMVFLGIIIGLIFYMISKTGKSKSSNRYSIEKFEKKGLHGETVAYYTVKDKKTNRDIYITNNIEHANNKINELK